MTLARRHPLLLVAFAMLLHVVVVVDGAGSLFVPLKLGIDYERTMSDEDLLRGYKLNVADGENPIKNKVFTGVNHTIPFTTSYTESKVVTAATEIQDSLEIKGSLSVSYGPMISGEGAGRYFEDKVNSDNQITIIYRTRRVAYAKQVKVDTIRLLDKLTNNDNIGDQYGTKFVDQIVYGAQLDVRFTVTSKLSIDVEEIEAELKGKIGVGPLSVGFSAKFEKKSGTTESEYNLEILAEASGINVNVPANPTFEQTNTIIQDFNTRYDDLLTELKERYDFVDEPTNVLARLSPVGFTLSSISDYIDNPRTLNSTQAAILDLKMEDLSELLFDALYWRSVLKLSLEFATNKYGIDPRQRVDLLNPYEDAVQEQMVLLDQTIDKIFRYRGRPLADIVEEPLPSRYPNSTMTKNVLHGLAGNGYLENYPNHTDFHYIGYVLLHPEQQPSSNYLQLDADDPSVVFIPWMEGTVRRNADNRVVASGDTTDELDEEFEEYLIEVQNFVPTVFYYDDWVVTELDCDYGRTNSRGSDLDDITFYGPVQLVWETSLDFEESAYFVELYQLNNRLFQSRIYDGFVAYNSSGLLPKAANDQKPAGNASKANEGKGGYYVQLTCTLCAAENGTRNLQEDEPTTISAPSPIKPPSASPTMSPTQKQCGGSSFRWVLVDCGCPDGMVPDESCMVHSIKNARGAVCVTKPSVSPYPSGSPFPSFAPTNSPQPTSSFPPTPLPTLLPTPVPSSRATFELPETTTADGGNGNNGSRLSRGGAAAFGIIGGLIGGLIVGAMLLFYVTKKADVYVSHHA